MVGDAWHTVPFGAIFKMVGTRTMNLGEILKRDRYVPTILIGEMTSIRNTNKRILVEDLKEINVIAKFIPKCSDWCVKEINISKGVTILIHDLSS